MVENVKESESSNKCLVTLSLTFSGDLFTLQKMSDHPAAFTEVDTKGWYPLHRASVQQSVQVLELVIFGEQCTCKNN